MYINLCSLFSDFTHILCVNHYVNLSTCQPVNQNMLFNNFIYTSTFTCNIEISYAFIYVDRYVNLSTGRPEYCRLGRPSRPVDQHAIFYYTTWGYLYWVIDTLYETKAKVLWVIYQQRRPSRCMSVHRFPPELHSPLPIPSHLTLLTPLVTFSSTLLKPSPPHPYAYPPLPPSHSLSAPTPSLPLLHLHRIPQMVKNVLFTLRSPQPTGPSFG